MNYNGIKHIAPYTRTIEDVQEGDVITNGRNYTYVHGVCGSAVIVSGFFDVMEKAHIRTNAECYYSIDELMRKGYTINQPKSLKPVEELTMEQVCKELGREVKIKK